MTVSWPPDGRGILTYRIVPLHDTQATGWPVTGYLLTMTGLTKTSSGPEVRVGRFDTAAAARATLAGIPAAHIDDETAVLA